MSETAISRFAISRPLALLTFRLRLFLLTFVSLKFPEVFKLTSRCCGVVVLGSRPRSLSGHSILMISAPKAPSHRVAHGPARTQLKSTTRMFSRARGLDMASFSCWGQALRLAERDADKAEHQERGEPERDAAEHIDGGDGIADRAYRGQGGSGAAMLVGAHAVHRPGDEMHVVDPDAKPHHERADRHKREP